MFHTLSCAKAHLSSKTRDQVMPSQHINTRATNETSSSANTPLKHEADLAAKHTIIFACHHQKGQQNIPMILSAWLLLFLFLFCLGTEADPETHHTRSYQYYRPQTPKMTDTHTTFVTRCCPTRSCYPCRLYCGLILSLMMYHYLTLSPPTVSMMRTASGM
mmetsp:Transcript_9246/g.13717  ORF Transcript_9246/g.13717 Transcript_9246/m.13717 type:complete len:161 (-) Transcript_9246:181-663(-)